MSRRLSPVVPIVISGYDTTGRRVIYSRFNAVGRVERRRSSVYVTATVNRKKKLNLIAGTFTVVKLKIQADFRKAAPKPLNQRVTRWQTFVTPVLVPRSRKEPVFYESANGMICEGTHTL